MLSRSGWHRYGVLCVLCGVLAVMSGCSDRRSEQLRAEGDTLRGLKRIDAAREAYEKSKAANPENPMAVLGLARCSVLEGNVDEAQTLFQEALALDASLEEAYQESIRMLVGAGRMEEALAISDDYTAQHPRGGGTLRGVVLMKMGRIDEAIDVLSALSETYPEGEEIQFDLGAALLKGGRSDEAEVLFQKLASGNSSVAAAARMGLIDVYRAQGRVEELIGEFAALAESRPDDLGIQLGYARALLLAERAEEAEEIARGVLEKDPESGWANYIVGVRKVEAEAYDEAKAFLEQAVRALPDNVEVKNLLAFAASGGAAPPGAEPGTVVRPTKPVPAVKPTTWEGLWKQAALNRLLDNREMYLAEGGVSARETLTMAAIFTYQAALTRELADGLPEDSKVRGFVDAFFTQEAPKLAAHFESWQPEEVDETVLRDNALGFSMIAGGTREQGLSVFLFCLERWPDHGVALFNISQVFRRLNQPMIAAQNLQRLIAMYPENIDAHQMHYTALREGRAFDAARRAAEASYTLFPDERWSHLYLCQAYLDTGEPALALQWLSRATNQFPNDPEFQAVMARVLVRMGDCGQATGVLEGISTTAPAIIGARDSMLALCRVLDGDWAGATEIAKSAPEGGRGDGLTLLLAAGLMQAGEGEAALAALVPEEGQSPAAGRFGQILIAALGGDTPELTDEERAWGTTLGADPALLSAYATVVALQSNDLNDAAWKYYQEHLSTQPPHIALAQLAYRALGSNDAIEDAGERARAVAESLSGDARAWLGLSVVLKSLDDVEGESEAIEKALSVDPRSPEALFRHASMMEQKGNIEKAVQDYRVLLEVAPDSGAANNNLAYTLLLAGDKDEEALTYATVAAEKLPRDPGVLHTLGLAQMRLGNLEESRNNLKRATEMDPTNPTIMYDYGRLLAQVDEKDEARKRVRNALVMSKNAGLAFPQESEAEVMLESLQP